MKYRFILLLIVLFLFSATVFSQKKEAEQPVCQFDHYGNLSEIQPEIQNYDNILVKKLCSDKNASSFLIWVKKEVKLHYHAEHTENVYVVSGTGKMKLGEQEFDIKKGDWLYIPEKTPHAVITTSDVPLKVLSIQSPEFKGQDRVIVE